VVGEIERPSSRYSLLVIHIFAKKQKEISIHIFAKKQKEVSIFIRILVLKEELNSATRAIHNTHGDNHVVEEPLQHFHFHFHFRSHYDDGNVIGECCRNERYCRVYRWLFGSTQSSKKCGGSWSSSMGSQTCKLCAQLCKTEKGRLPPTTFGQPLRREHILGKRPWLDPFAGSGCVDRWEEMVWLCQQYLHRTWLHSLHSGCMENYRQCWLRQDYMQFRRYFHNLQLWSTRELHRKQALLKFTRQHSSSYYIHSFNMNIFCTTTICYMAFFFVKHSYKQYNFSGIRWQLI